MKNYKSRAIWVFEMAETTTRLTDFLVNFLPYLRFPPRLVKPKTLFWTGPSFFLSKVWEECKNGYQKVSPPAP